MSKPSEYNTVEVKFVVYVPSNIKTDEDIADYLNNKLESDPEYFGEIDSGCVTILAKETF